jgi:micrococcal nuclease
MRIEVLITTIVITILGCVVVLLLRSSAYSIEIRETAFVTRVIDGDTIVIEGGQKIRLLGIDSRERGENCYAEAREWLKSMIEMKNISLERDGEDKDKYGRLLRYVWYNDTNVNVRLVREGLAIVYLEGRPLKYENELREAEAIARKEGTGCLWASVK